MLKDFLTEVQQQSIFELPIFGSQLFIRGRILSPSEIEKASLMNSLMLQALASTGELSQVQQMSKKLQEDEVDENIMQQAYSILSKIRPEQIEQINKSQDLLVAQCISHARKSEDDEWEKIQIVLTQQEQNPDRNMLWVGMIPQNDRQQIISMAMNGHKGAVERLATFR